MLRSQTWNPQKIGAFFANVFLCNILSQNCFHKHDIYNLSFYLIIHVRHSNVKIVGNIQRQNNNHKTRANKAISFFWFLLGDFNISNIFYKIQNLNKQQLVSVITHWTYTCLNPWALRKKGNEKTVQNIKVKMPIKKRMNLS